MSKIETARGKMVTDSQIPEKNILVVEDDEDTAQLLGLRLLMAGYGVRIARNRDEALEHIKRNIYHFILLDYFMSGTNMEVFLKETEKYCPISKIVLTTASPDALEVAKKHGLKHYFVKPIDTEVLLRFLSVY